MKVQLLGYRATTVTGVVISADNTANVDVTLGEAPIPVQEVVVSAKRPVVDLHATSNMAAVSRDQIRSLPVQELQDVVNLQAGVVTQGGDLHFRGGRGGEVQFQVDGVSVNNAYDNKSSLRIDRSLLEEVQVISGTFDAEYGQAMSGVVNAVLRHSLGLQQAGARQTSFARGGLAAGLYICRLRLENPSTRAPAGALTGKLMVIK